MEEGDHPHIRPRINWTIRKRIRYTIWTFLYYVLIIPPTVFFLVLVSIIVPIIYIIAWLFEKEFWKNTEAEEEEKDWEKSQNQRDAELYLKPWALAQQLVDYKHYINIRGVEKTSYYKNPLDVLEEALGFALVMWGAILVVLLIFYL